MPKNTFSNFKARVLADPAPFAVYRLPLADKPFTVYRLPLVDNPVCRITNWLHRITNSVVFKAALQMPLNRGSVVFKAAI